MDMMMFKNDLQLKYIS